MPQPQAERRHLTVLFIDLVGSTGLSEELDPEDYREILREYQAICATVIERFEGHVAQYLGDGLLVYFGYPLAHEDDARRAVLSALNVLEAIAGWAERLKRQRGLDLNVRLGIHTGLVVAGTVGSGYTQEQLALGQTPNVAARLQSLADPGTAVCSAATYELVRAHVEAVALGTKSIRGLSKPVEIYRIQSETRVTGHLEAVSRQELTPRVGREQELRRLWQHFCEARAGQGRTVLLIGEAGIGKSRLLRSFRDRLAGGPHTWLICHGSPYHKNTAFYPIVESIEKISQLRDDEAPARKLRKLESTIEQLGLPAPETVPLLASLLSLRPPDKFLSSELAQQQKQKTLAALLALWSKLAEEKPLVFVIEDLHWVDPSTLEALDRLMRHLRTAHSLILLSARPSFTPPWEDGSAGLETLVLDRLRSAEVEAMVLGLTRNKALPREVLRQVVEKTDGVPLFVEELTKMVLESGLLREEEGGYELTGALPPLAIPETLQASLMARLDRNPDIRQLAALGAVLGRTFPYELIRATARLDEPALERYLGRLVETRLLYQRGVPPQATYIFRHALIQDISYRSLLRATRQEHHGKVVQVLEDRFPGTVRNQPEVLAHHASEAQLAEKAIGYWQAAAGKALEHSAHVEAAHHLNRGHQLLAKVSDPARRDELELALLTVLGPVYMAIRGFASEEVEGAYGRARELCRQIGETPSLFPVLLGLYRYYGVRADWPVARELSEQLLDLAEAADRPEFLIEARRALGGVLFHLGELPEARRHLEDGLAIYLSQKQDMDALRYALHPGMNCLVYLALDQAFLGALDDARETIGQAVELGQELGHLSSLTFALGAAASIEQLRRDVAGTYRWADDATRLSQKHGLPTMGTYGHILRGWARAIGGEPTAGLAEMREGLAAWKQQGAGATLTYFLGLLAESLHHSGRPEESLRALDEALARVESNGESFFEAELLRLKGEYLLYAVASAPAAEASFKRALAVARRQNARIFELRAALSLTRLWREQNRLEPGSPLLGAAYAKLPPGLDTADMHEARQLLEELARLRSAQADPTTSSRL